MYDRIIAYDLETTGLNRRTDKILEIGAVSYDPKTKTRETFSTLIAVSGLIDWRTTLITAIDDNTLSLEGCKPLKDALKSFVEFCYKDCKTSLFVGHNILVFDNPFINKELYNLRLPKIQDRHTWDTLRQTWADIAKIKTGDFRTKQRKAKRPKQKTNLLAACQFYKIKPNPVKHRALPDAENSLAIFLKQSVKTRFRR